MTLTHTAHADACLLYAKEISTTAAKETCYCGKRGLLLQQQKRPITAAAKEISTTAAKETCYCSKRGLLLQQQKSTAVCHSCTY